MNPVSPDLSGAEAALEGARQVSVRSLMLGSGPRFARDAFGPLVVYFAVSRLVGLPAGILAATAMSLWAYRYERKQARTGNMAKIALGFVLIQGIVGLATHNEILYLAQPVILSAAFGLAFILTTALGRPLAAVFAEEVYPFPQEVKDSATFKRIFSRLSIAWGVYQLLRSALRLLSLIGSGVGVFLVVNFVTGVPMVAAMMSWSIWYGLRGFRASEEWGWALRGEAPPPEIAARYEAAG